ncbi:MAG TPA: protein kinase [Polyangia bacterium]|nr:protein kinase [Polyangia bacterium]
MAKKSSKKGDPLIGAIIDRRWQVLDQLGAGGMGVVYRAERIGLGKQVALKFLHQSVAESKAAVARFEREAKAISRLHHVHCISILDFGVYRRQPYIVMEFVQGRQLTELDPATMTPHRAVTLVRQVLLGLQHAHSRGVIHRDLKLSNMMLVEMTGTENLVKLLDFGLARISGVDEELSLTEGMVAGTPSYMSPEQAEGKKTDLRSDIYSAGVVLYVLSTGKRPFVASDATALMRMQVDDAPPPPRRAAPGKRISEGLERVILRALEKRPADRFQSATDFLTALDDTQEGQETLTPTVLRDRGAPRWRWRLMTVAAAACIALGAAGALWARAHYLRLQTQALGAYERWAGPPAPTPAAPANDPTATATRPEPTATRPEPTATKSEPTVTKPEPAATKPEPTATKPEPTATKPEPASATGATVATGEPSAQSDAVEHETAELPDPPAPALPPAPATRPAAQPAAAPPPRGAKRAPLAADAHDWRQQIDQLISEGKVNPAKNQLRDHLAVDENDGWAHLRLGDLYAEPFHYRRDAIREWDSAFVLAPALKSDAAFRRSLCEVADTTDQAGAQQFLREQLGVEPTAALLLACIRATVEPSRIENTARLIEAVAGGERPELAMAALRMLDVGKSCAQKKAAVEVIRRLHYLRARGALITLDRVRLAQAHHPSPAVACFGTTIADTIEQLK